MEVVLFHRPGKKATPARAKPLKDLTAIVSPSQFLADAKRNDLLLKIKELSALEDSRFDNLCVNLIHHLINHCQSMPETFNSYYAMPGGLVDHTLHRTEAALSLFRQYIVQDSGVELSEEQKLWIYALLTAGILKGIGKLQIDYRVDLFDVNGQFLKQWSPLLESMASVGSHYEFEFQPQGEDDFRRRLNLLMARLLMPASGFAWLASNTEVLAVWLALLNEDEVGAGTLGAILIRADAIAIQRYFNEFMIKVMGRRGARSARIGTFVDSVPDTIEKERALGLEFIQWLTAQLATGKIILNQAPLLMVPGGMLMSAELFQWFVREHPDYKNWQAVQNAFFSLNLHHEGVEDNAQKRVVFSDYAIALPESMKIHNANTGETSTISAVELIHLAHFNSHAFNQQDSGGTISPLNHLSASGDWQPVDVQTNSLANFLRG